MMNMPLVSSTLESLNFLMTDILISL